MQGQFNDVQIKYYKIQKECDNLQMDKDESEHKYTQVQKQLKAEREIHHI